MLALVGSVALGGSEAPFWKEFFGCEFFVFKTGDTAPSTTPSVGAHMDWYYIDLSGTCAKPFSMELP